MRVRFSMREIMKVYAISSFQMELFQSSWDGLGLRIIGLDFRDHESISMRGSRNSYFK